MISVPLGVICGAALGIAAYRHPRFEAALRPVLDLMQTLPAFAYLIPLLLLFGFGPAAGLVASIVFAAPPMVRNTMLGLRLVPGDIITLADYVSFRYEVEDTLHTDKLVPTMPGSATQVMDDSPTYTPAPPPPPSYE